MTDGRWQGMNWWEDIMRAVRTKYPYVPELCGCIKSGDQWRFGTYVFTTVQVEQAVRELPEPTDSFNLTDEEMRKEWER